MNDNTKTSKFAVSDTRSGARLLDAGPKRQTKKASNELPHLNLDETPTSGYGSVTVRINTDDDTREVPSPLLSTETNAVQQSAPMAAITSPALDESYVNRGPAPSLLSLGSFAASPPILKRHSSYYAPPQLAANLINRGVTFSPSMAPASPTGNHSLGLRRPLFKNIGDGKFLPSAEAMARSEQRRGKGASASQPVVISPSLSHSLGSDRSSIVSGHPVPATSTSNGVPQLYQREGSYLLSSSAGAYDTRSLLPQVAFSNPTGATYENPPRQVHSPLLSISDHQYGGDIYSDDSVESDFDYDEDGNAQTYYKKPRRSSHSYLNTDTMRGPSTDAPNAARRVSAINGNNEADMTSSIASSQLASSLTTQANLPLNAYYDRTAATRASAKLSRLYPGALSTVSEKGAPSVLELPEGLRALGKQIHKLGTEDLLYISSMVSRKANREAYSVLQYTGKAWYLPSIRKTRDGEPPFACPRYSGDGLTLTLGGKVLSLQVGSYLVRLALFCLFWLLVWAALPQQAAQPQGAIFDPLITFLVASVIGGFICRVLQIPPLVGVLWIAILWNNVPYVGYLTSGILPEVKVVASRLGLTVVLLRAGFSTNWKALQPIWKNVSLLALFAVLLEGGIHTVLAYWLFDYNSWVWASLEGFICAAPSAAIIVPGSLLLQSDGFSRSRGPLPLMLSTVGVETVIGVWISSFINGLAVTESSLTLSIVLGPIQIIGGIILGTVMAFLFTIAVGLLRNEAKRLPNGDFSEAHLTNVNRLSLVIFLISAFATIFVGYKYDLGGGACVTVMLLSAITAHLWSKDGDPELLEHKRSLGIGLSNTWELLVMPFLFSMTGTKVDIQGIFNAKVFPKGLLIWVCSISARMGVVFLSCSGLQFSVKEKVFACGAWVAKATVQSALSGVALTAVNARLSGLDPAAPNYVALLADRDRAKTVQNVAILFVILSAPTAAVWITKAGPRLLRND